MSQPFPCVTTLKDFLLFRQAYYITLSVQCQVLFFSLLAVLVACTVQYKKILFIGLFSVRNGYCLKEKLLDIEYHIMFYRFIAESVFVFRQ